MSRCEDLIEKGILVVDRVIVVVIDDGKDEKIGNDVEKERVERRRNGREGRERGEV